MQRPVCDACQDNPRPVISDSSVEETEFRIDKAQLLTPRIVLDLVANDYVAAQMRPPKTEPARFLDGRRLLSEVFERPGARDYALFVDDTLHQAPLTKDEVLIQTTALSIEASSDDGGPRIGFKCSGRIVAMSSYAPHLRIDHRVAAITDYKSMSTITRVASRFVFPIPDHISCNAITVLPHACSTATYALIEHAKLTEPRLLLFMMLE